MLWHGDGMATPDPVVRTPRQVTIAAAAALVTSAAGGAGYWLLTGPVTARLPTVECLGQDCLFASDAAGLGLVGLVLLWLARLLLVVAAFGVVAVVTGALLVRRWPDHTTARVAGGVLVLAPPVGVTAATGAIAFLHLVG